MSGIKKTVKTDHIPCAVEALPRFVARARTPEHQKSRRFGWFAYHSAYIDGAWDKLLVINGEIYIIDIPHRPTNF